MRRINKNLVKAVTLGLLLGVPYTAQAADYSEMITGSKDNYGKQIKSNNGNEYTYDFVEPASLKLTGKEYGIVITTNKDIGNSDVDKIIIKDKLDIEVNNIISSGNAAAGIGIQGKQAEIDRSQGGNINLNYNGDKWINISGASISLGDGSTINLGSGDITVANTSSTASQANGLLFTGAYTTSADRIIYNGGTMDIDAKTTVTTASPDACGILIDNSSKGGTVELNNAVTIYADAVGGQYANAGGFLTSNSSGLAEITGSNSDVIMNIKASGATDENYAYGINLSGAKGNVSLKNVNITAVAEGGTGTYVNGIYATANNTIDVSGKTVINVNVDGDTDAISRGIRVNGGTVNLNIVDITATAKGEGVAYGILSEGGTTNISGGIVKGDTYSIYANNGTVNLNQGTTKNDVIITGDIAAETADAQINLNLNTKNSYFEGCVYDWNFEDIAQSSINLNVSDSAVWKMTDTANSSVGKLRISDGGILDMTSGEKFRKLTVGDFSGNNGIIKMKISSTKNNSINVDGTHKGTHFIDISEVGDNINAKGTVLVKVKDEQGSFAANDKEGTLFWTAYDLKKETTSGDYTVNWVIDDIYQTDKATTTVDAVLGAGALNYHTWRAENDQLMRRMGELRANGADEEGAWFRVHGSKISRDDNAAFENKYTSYELGYDQITKQTEDVTRYTGAALSYTDGSSTYNSGSGENHSKALSFYNTDIYSSGHYLDLVFKFANMDNDFNVYDANGNTINGEYKNNGISLSAEYGRKNELHGGWYVEPQAQLTLGYFGGDEYETSNGVKVEQGGITSLLGRIGFNIGKELGDNGVVYAKANLLHEFGGDYDVDMTDSTGISRSESESFNDTWFEYGIGAAIKTGKNNHLYFDLAKTTGGDFEKEWTWNAGMRWTF